MLPIGYKEPQVNLYHPQKIKCWRQKLKQHSLRIWRGYWFGQTTTMKIQSNRLQKIWVGIELLKFNYTYNYGSELSFKLQRLNPQHLETWEML